MAVSSRHGQRSSARVLIVEPERRYLEMLARRVADGGYRVAIAQSVQQAVAELYRIPVDLILAEAAGRNFNAGELLGVVRTDAVLRDIPLMVLTGRSDRPAAVRALRDGADATITKPFHFDVLFARIQREIERRRTIEELRRAHQALDARIIERAIAIGELQDRLARSESERLRLELNLARMTP